MGNATRDLVLNFIARNGRKPVPANEQELMACAYLDAGIIDSLGVIEMVSEFESKFSIRFSADDLQSDQFLTIGGLIALINRLRAAKE